jgi:hypothetical protein
MVCYKRFTAYHEHNVVPGISAYIYTDEQDSAGSVLDIMGFEASHNAQSGLITKEQLDALRSSLGYTRAELAGDVYVRRWVIVISSLYSVGI